MYHWAASKVVWISLKTAWRWVREELALFKEKKGIIEMPLEGAKAGVQIGATHSLSEPGTFALGFSLNIITWVSTTVSSEQPRAIQEAWERTGTGFSRSTWPFLLFKTTTLNEPAGETGPACPGAAAQRCPGAGCWVSADTLVFLLSWNPTGVVSVSAQLCHKFLESQSDRWAWREIWSWLRYPREMILDKQLGGCEQLWRY